jgi:Tetratricopeptide repeat
VYARGKCADAERFLQKAFALRSRLQGLEHAELVTTLTLLGQIYRWKNGGDWRKAKEFFGDAVAVSSRYLGPDHPDTAEPLCSLGLITRVLGDNREAEQMILKSLGILESTLGSQGQLYRPGP